MPVYVCARMDVSWLAVQAALLPVMTRSSVRYGHPGDLCVAAPTGSGKTLAYVLPIVQVRPSSQPWLRSAGRN